MFYTTTNYYFIKLESIKIYIKARLPLEEV